jgi:hypothetical protein
VARITLVCTVHREMGLCNEDELIVILNAIGPDVIFDEIRQADFDSHYQDASKHTLEMRAVVRDWKVRPARQVPVDDFAIPRDFPRHIDSVFEYAESTSIEFRALVGERDQKTFHSGFRYLNSPEFEALSKRARELFEKAIVLSGRDDLQQWLSTWNDLLLRRDASMVDNIYDFCRKSQFTEGVFLVGAEHMWSIAGIIEKRIQTENDLVAWNIGTFPG